MNLMENLESKPSVAPPEAKAEKVETKESEPRREGPPPSEKFDAPAATQAEAAPGAPPAPAAPAQPKDPYLMKVERILEDNLLDVYISMPAASRARFKAAGEATAMKIWALVERSKVRAKSVLRLIWDWLRLIPGVSRYFLEQEAKIKTDKIIQLAEERRKEKEGQI